MRRVVTAQEGQPRRSSRRVRSIPKNFVLYWFPSCAFVSLVVKVVKVELLSYELRFGRNAWRDLYLRFALRLPNESGARTFHAQAYIPTQPAQAIEDTRISHAHEDPGRQEGNFPPARQGAQTGLGETRFPRIVQCGARPRLRGRASASGRW